MVSLSLATKLPNSKARIRTRSADAVAAMVQHSCLAFNRPAFHVPLVCGPHSGYPG